MPASIRLFAVACLLLPGPSAEAGPGAGPCAGCGPLPPGYRIDLTACAPAAPALHGEAGPARPASVGIGRMLAVATEGSVAPGIWLGVDDGGVAYAALFNGGARAAQACVTLGQTAGARRFEAASEPATAGRTIVAFTALAVWDDARCVTREERFHVARLSDGRWELLAKVQTCRSEEEKRLRERLTRRFEGAAARKSGDLPLAIERLRGALPDAGAAAELAELLIGQDGFMEAERLLAFALSDGGPRIPTLLALEQLFTRAGKPQLAGGLHRQYLAALAKNADREPEPRYRFCTDETVQGEAAPDAGQALTR